MLPTELNSYVNAGLKVFPLQENKKIPLPYISWKQLTTNNPDHVNAWITSPNEVYQEMVRTFSPDKIEIIKPICAEFLNFGVSTGRDNQISVIDVDVKAGGLESYETIKDKLPAPHVKTQSGGYHIYFKYSESLKQTVNLLPGIDIRNDGGYVVIPPSKGYKLLRPLTDLTDIPQDILNLQNNPAKKENNIETNEDGLIPEGGRNHYLTSIAGYLRKQGTPSEAIAGALTALNDEALDTPLPEWELTTIANSIARYEPDPFIFEDKASKVVRAKDLCKPMLEYLNNKELVKGEPTGADGLDHLLGGGKRLGEITCWHAEAKTGKNTYWHFLMHKWLNKGIPIAYASRELNPEEEVLPNLISLEHNIDAWQKDTNPDQYKDSLNQWPLYFASGYGYMPIKDIHDWVVNCLEHGIKYFFIDHLHYCLDNPEDHQEASKFIKQLKTMAKKYKVHFDIIIQPNKLMDGQRLSKNTIKGGSAMGQTIDNLIIMQRLKDIDNTTEVSLVDTRSKLSRLGKYFIQYKPKDFSFIEVDVKETD